MSDRVLWVSGGGQPGYFQCSHSGCQKKARNVDPWHRSAELRSGDHLCCGHSKHTTAHANRARDREDAEVEAARATAPPGPVLLLIRALVRRVLGGKR